MHNLTVPAGVKIWIGHVVRACLTFYSTVAGKIEMLQQRGFTVIEAGSAEEALAALSSMRIDVLVTDVNLPGMSGPDLAIHARGALPNMGIVFATGDESVPHAVAGSVVLTKPYGDEDLGAAIVSAVGRKGSSERAATETQRRRDGADSKL